MSEFTNNTEKSQFELEMNGHIAFAQYRMEGQTLFIDYVFSPEALRGTGAAGKLMEQVVAVAKAQSLEIVPICGYAAAWLKKNT